eukprot:TRINITY_DN15721_c0_g1_i1.p1 TRINITY_DN15721_c0_g1~~TRINITY_DN15721_c0_g1_i1.p1  ORF type:complete len:525 (+),score=132.35 TRINITY_DN15721_c0_g1_i1:40-1614(+)
MATQADAERLKALFPNVSNMAEKIDKSFLAFGRGNVVLVSNNGQITEQIKYALNKTSICEELAITGIKRTNPKLLFEFLERIEDADTMIQAVQASVDIKKLLESYGRYNNIEFDFLSLDEDYNKDKIKVIDWNEIKDKKKKPESSKHNFFKKKNRYIDDIPFQVKNRYKVLLDIDEKKRNQQLSIGSEIEKNDIGIHGKMTWYNLLGNFEKLYIEASVSAKTDMSIRGNFIKPLFSRNAQFEANLYQNLYNHPNQSYVEKINGLSLSYSSFHDFVFKGIEFETIESCLTYDVALRENRLDSTIQSKVIYDGGYSLKSSIKHTLCIDTLDNKVSPKRGFAVKAINEFAGILGNVHFFKQELLGCCHYTPPKIPFVTFNMRNSIGWMINWKDKDTKINDRFFIGGVPSLRGFQYRGVGPRHNADYTGGDLYFSNSEHITFDPPNIDSMVKFHLFANVANLSNFSEKKNIYSSFYNLFTKNVRAVWGAGVIFNLGARVEINLIKPILKNPTDITRDIQFGVSLEFLS